MIIVTQFDCVDLEFMYFTSIVAKHVFRILSFGCGFWLLIGSQKEKEDG